MKKQYLFLFIFYSIGCSLSAQIVNIPDANFKDALINERCGYLFGINGIQYIDANSDGEIQVSEAQNVRHLQVIDKDIVSMEGIAAFSNLEVIDCRLNSGLQSIDISQLGDLKTFRAESCSLMSLDVTQNPNLERLICYYNNLSSIDVTQNPNLESLSCHNNNLTSIDVSQNPLLRFLTISGNQISSLDVSNNPILYSLKCGHNNLTSLSITNNPALYEISCPENPLTVLDINNNQNTSLRNLYCYNTNLTEIDVTNCPSFIKILCQQNPYLEAIYMKNGWIYAGQSDFEYFDFSSLPSLQYICLDEAETAQIQALLSNYNYTDVVINSYCSFTPGGNFSTVSGSLKFDENADGCDASDPVFPNVTFQITNGSDQGELTANASGNYSIEVLDGVHTITPQLEYSSYFSIQPTSITVDFPTDASPNIQDFCITANGIYNDLEIIIIPLEQARPGFDTDYKIIYKNSGTTTLSGNVHLAFEDDFMDFVSANPSADTQTTGNLSWNYVNLAPLESRSIEFTMSLNTPIDAAFPLNGGDQIDFDVAITPVVTDETPANNASVLKQLVVNSFDPNDKTCLEGNTITEDQVGEYVHYLIRFENTGTASAINVVVKDVINVVKYDVNSLIVLDGSHDFITKKDGQTFEFIFENINLPFDDANNDGYVLFKIKTRPWLVLDDNFLNRAEIFFDYNAPIITNDEVTIVTRTLSVTESSLDATIKVFPKPATETLYIQGENSIQTIDVYSLQGKLVISKKFIGNQTNVDLSLKSISKGFYILKATSNKGVFVDKIIKQ